MKPCELILLKGMVLIIIATFFSRVAHAVVSLAVERLALVLGGDITSTFDNPEKVRLGHCAKIEEVIIGEDKVRCSPYLKFVHIL